MVNTPLVCPTRYFSCIYEYILPLQTFYTLTVSVLQDTKAKYLIFML